MCICRFCNLEFPRRGRSGKPPEICDNCKPYAQSLRNKKFKEKNKDIRVPSGVYKVRNLKGKYGLTLDEFTKMLEDQNYSCLICSSAEKLVVDHCHDTNKVRGILCNSCNLSLGWAKDNPDTLRKLAEYVESSRME